MKLDIAKLQVVSFQTGAPQAELVSTAYPPTHPTAETYCFVCPAITCEGC